MFDFQFENCKMSLIEEMNENKESSVDKSNTQINQHDVSTISNIFNEKDFENSNLNGKNSSDDSEILIKTELQIGKSFLDEKESKNEFLEISTPVEQNKNIEKLSKVLIQEIGGEIIGKY